MSILTIYNRCLDALNLVYVSHDFYAFDDSVLQISFVHKHILSTEAFLYIPKVLVGQDSKEKHKACYFSITEIVFINILKQYSFFSSFEY